MAGANRSVGGEAYEELDELYDVWCAEVTEDVPFYVQLAGALAREADTRALRILELGAGSGRITVPLAAAGHEVVALDAAPAQLARLAMHADAAGAAVAARITTVCGDMRRLEALVDARGQAQPFDLVLAPFRCLLHVTPEREAVFTQVARLLRAEGVFAFDVFHPTAEQVAATHDRWLPRSEVPTTSGRWKFAERATYRPDAAAEPGGLALDVDVRCRWRAARLRGTTRDALADPTPGSAHARETTLQLQLIPAERWEQALLRSGFAIDGAYAWFDARPLEPDADDSVWVARRPALPA